MNTTDNKQNNDDEINDNETLWVFGPTKHFFDDFIKIKQLGRSGQYGAAYQCLRKSDKQLFAVKFMKKTRFSRTNSKYTNLYLSMIRDEINNLSALNHKNIIKLDSVYEDNTMIYIVMEECIGGELFECINKKGRYSEESAASIIKQLLSALRYMHNDKNIVHCDLKPANILFLNKTENSPIKIIDFGMSKFIERLQSATNECGSIYYMAPELITNNSYNHQYDMWTLGVILFVMIFGYPPFYCDPSQNEIQLIKDKIARGFEPKIKSTETYGYGPWFPDHIESSQEVRDLITGLLQKDVSSRYTAKEALTHPWFEKMGLDHDVNDIILSRLLRFDNGCPFKLVISTIFRNEFYCERGEYLQQLQELINKYNTQENGVLSFEEFEAMFDDMKYINIDKKYVGTIYQRLTSSPIGIDIYQLLNALVYDYLISSDERLEGAIRKLVDDNDGQIELKHLREKVMSVDPAGQWDKIIESLAAECVDPNGGIFFEEFLVKLHPNFEAVPEWIPDLFKSDYAEIKNVKTKQNDVSKLRINIYFSFSSFSSNEYTLNTPVTPIIDETANIIASYK